MTITVNGSVHKIQLGCRTFITVTELLETLQVDTSLFPSLLLNDTVIGKPLFQQTNVTTGDMIGFTTKPHAKSSFA
jgi:hypothetical protein